MSSISSAAIHASRLFLFTVSSAVTISSAISLSYRFCYTFMKCSLNSAGVNCSPSMFSLNSQSLVHLPYVSSTLSLFSFSEHSNSPTLFLSSLRLFILLADSISFSCVSPFLSVSTELTDFSFEVFYLLHV